MISGQVKIYLLIRRKKRIKRHRLGRINRHPSFPSNQKMTLSLTTGRRSFNDKKSHTPNFKLTHYLKISQSSMKAQPLLASFQGSLIIVRGFTISSSPLADDEESGTKLKISASKTSNKTFLNSHKGGVIRRVRRLKTRYRRVNCSPYIPKVAGSNPTPATMLFKPSRASWRCPFCVHYRSRVQACASTIN